MRSPARTARATRSSKPCSPTRVDDGLLGSFRFDENGDITESPITILRVARGGASSRIPSLEGGIVERVVRPSPSLVATGN
jgi:hypothetical protein